MKYTFINNKITADITYRRGKLAVIDVKKGTFDLELLSMLVPALEKHVDTRDMLPHAPKKQRSSFYQPARVAWMEFYQNRTKIPYRFTAADGQSLVQIGNFLDNLDSDTGAVVLWQQMLSNWNRLEPFYRDNLDLKFINGQLNKIINQLKNGKQASNHNTRDNADDLRRQFQG